MWEDPSVRLRGGETSPALMRYFAETSLIRLVQQYSEINEERARGIVSDLIGACLRQWCGEFMESASRTDTRTQKFWLCGPERTVTLWVRFNEPYYDVIAKLGEPRLPS